MKTIILFLGILMMAACQSNMQPSGQDIASTDTNQSTTDITDDTTHEVPYELKVHIERHEPLIYDLIIDMKLFHDAYFVSPNAKKDFKGKFKFVIDDTDAFKLIGGLIETPLTKETLATHLPIAGPVNLVKSNTTYTQRIQVKALEEFQVMGSVQFVIEPQCTLEKIPVIIKYQDGYVKFEIFGC